MAKKVKKAAKLKSGAKLKTFHAKLGPVVPPAPAMPTAPDLPEGTIKLERLGAVQTWKVPAAPYAGQKNIRLAYVGGFHARTQAWLGHVDGCPVRFSSVTLQNAFEDGYNDAKRQEGAKATSKKKTLIGSPA